MNALNAWPPVEECTDNDNCPVWEKWPLVEKFADGDICPDCGNPLIVVEHVSSLDTSDIYAAICTECKKQYTVFAETGMYIPNPIAAMQATRINALEARVAELERMVHSLAQELSQKHTTRMHEQAPEAPKDDSDSADFRKKYGYLLS